MWSDEFFADYYEETLGDWCTHGNLEQRCAECAGERAREDAEAEEARYMAYCDEADVVTLQPVTFVGDAQYTAEEIAILMRSTP